MRLLNTGHSRESLPTGHSNTLINIDSNKITFIIKKQKDKVQLHRIASIVKPLKSAGTIELVMYICTRSDAYD